MAKRKFIVSVVHVNSREFLVSQAIASARLEGKATPHSWARVLDRYAAGETTNDELVAIANESIPNPLTPEVTGDAQDRASERR